MAIAPGSYEIGPGNGRVILRTFREGVAQAVGHDLVIGVGRWRGIVEMPAATDTQPRVAVELDMRSLEILEGVGGAKPLSDKDRQDIQKTITESLGTDGYPTASFVSKSVQVSGDRALLDGELTLRGVTQPLRLAVEGNGTGSVRGRAELLQTSWGIKPYKAFMGALKVRDAVRIDVEVVL